MVTPELACWNPAIQACWAASCELAPAPAISPSSEAPPDDSAAVAVPLSDEPSPQAATPTARASDAASPSIFRLFIFMASSLYGCALEPVTDLWSRCEKD